MFGLIICLHVNYRPDDRSSQPTLAKLKRTLQAYGLTSPRRVEALIARLVQVGYLRTEAAPGDRRAPLLVPCAPMIEHAREWLALHYATLSVLSPDDPPFPRPLAPAPASQRHLPRAPAGPIPAPPRALPPHPPPPPSP